MSEERFFLYLSGSIADVGLVGSDQREQWVANYRNDVSLVLGIRPLRVAVSIIRSSSSSEIEVSTSIYDVEDAGGEPTAAESFAFLQVWSCKI